MKKPVIALIVLLATVGPAVLGGAVYAVNLSEAREMEGAKVAEGAKVRKDAQRISRDAEILWAQRLECFDNGLGKSHADLTAEDLACMNRVKEAFYKRQKEAQ